MAKNFKGEEIEVGDIVSLQFNVVGVINDFIELRRVDMGGHFGCKAITGEISIVKKVEKPLAIGDKISISSVPDKAVTRTIVAFDGDKIVYRAECAGTSWHTSVSACSCKRDLR